MNWIQLLIINKIVCAIWHRLGKNKWLNINWALSIILFKNCFIRQLLLVAEQPNFGQSFSNCLIKKERYYTHYQ